MTRIWLIAFLLVLAASFPTLAASPPHTVNAADGIFAAFRAHSVVALGEWHALAQETDFYAVLLRDPRFASEVGNVVLEVGDAAQQATADKYVNGEDVPYSELRKVWSDGVGFRPTVDMLGSINLYAVIREMNASLPPDKRIKVWLGDPPIDWSSTHTTAQWKAIEDQRDSHAAALVEREILTKDKKALVIYGVGHFGVYPGYTNIRAILDKDYPGALYVILPWLGFTTRDCAAPVERQFKGAKAPSLIAPIRGSSLEKLLRPGCSPFPIPNDLTPEQKKSFATANLNNRGLTSDAFLYLGPRTSLTVSPSAPDIYLDLDFRKEISRHNEIMTGKPLMGGHPGNVAPRPYEQLLVPSK